MQKFKWIGLFAALALAIITGCIEPTPAPETQIIAPPPVKITSAPVDTQAGVTVTLAGLHDTLPDHAAARFDIRFQGAAPWLYQLALRSLPPQREVTLHIDGVDRSLNPGDVRVVTDGTTTWMTGAGTDQECVQFPNNQGMDPEFILPNDILPLSDLDHLLKYAGQETIAGKNAHHFKASGLAVAGWSDASVDVWMDPSGSTLLKLQFSASGDDPFFGTGAGAIQAGYEILTFTPSSIDPVSGCEIPLQLPASAENYVRMPGLASFETSASVEEIVRFYQEDLARSSWQESQPIKQNDGVTIMDYASPTQSVTIQISPVETGGAEIRLIFIDIE